MCRRCHPNLHDAIFNHQPLQVDFRDIGEVRRLLGDDYANRTDAEIANIRDLLVAFADHAFEYWRADRATRRSGNSSHTADTGADPAFPL